jgi:transposase
MQALVISMADQIAKLTEQVEQLTQRVAYLQAKLNTTSQNSSKPPSSDPPGAPRQKVTPSGRKRGGQPGHPGKRRPLIENPDQIVDHVATECDHCHAEVAGEAVDPDPVRYQVSEIPEPKVIVTEHRFHRTLCAACGRASSPVVPEEISASAFGPRLETTVALLGGQFRLSHREIQRYLMQQCHVELGLGSIPNILQRVSASLERPAAEAWDEVRRSAVRYVDETGWKEANKRAWVWVAVSEKATAFALATTRSAQVLRDQFGTALEQGTFVSDRCRSYKVIAIKRRGICHAHLKRDFTKMIDLGRLGKQLGEEALATQQKVFTLWHRFRDREITRDQLKNRMARHKTALRKTLEKGATHSKSPPKLRGMCRDILEHWPAMWTFVDTEGVEPTNNTAERALRKPVLWRKGSFGTQGSRGSRFVERILTVTQTCAQQGVHVAQYVEQAVRAFRQKLAPPALIRS